MTAKRSAKSQTKFPAETRAAEAVTVGWMLSMLCTLGALGIATVLAIGGAMAGGADGEPSPIEAAPSLLFFISLVCGAICLVFTYFAGRIRKTKPPAGITMFALVTGAAPWVIWIVLLAMRWS